MEGAGVENAVLNVDEPGLRPRAHVPASSAGLRCLVSGGYTPPPFTLVLELTLILLCELYGDVLGLLGFGEGWESPMMRVVTLLAVPVGVSSVGVGVDKIVLPLPKPNFHLLGFLTTTGLGASVSTAAATCLATLEA